LALERLATLRGRYRTGWPQGPCRNETSSSKVPLAPHPPLCQLVARRITQTHTAGAIHERQRHRASVKGTYAQEDSSSTRNASQKKRSDPTFLSAEGTRKRSSAARVGATCHSSMPSITRWAMLGCLA
jgi:hypothetical protein